MDKFVSRKRKDAEDSSCTPTTSCSADPGERPEEISSTSSSATNLAKAEEDSSERRLPNVKQNPGRRYQEGWGKTFHWLSYNVATEKAYCSFCCSAVNTLNVPVPDTSRDKDAHKAFVEVGFSDWKKALPRFRSHEQSNLHREAVVAIASVKPGVNVLSQFPQGQQKHMQDARKVLLTILSSVRYLVCQGSELFSQYEEESDLKRLLLLRAEDIPQVRSWLNRADDRWSSPAVVNEMLEIMAHSVLCTLMREIKAAEYYSVVLDAITPEQVAFCLRIATDGMVVEELCVGLYEAESAAAKSFFSVLKDVLRRFDLPLDRCRGQCYDGAANVGGHLSGVQALVKAEEPRALCAHRIAQFVNSVVRDVSGNVPLCGDFLRQFSDMVALVKASPRCRALFPHFEQGENINPQQCCPTKRIVRASTLRTVVSHYEELIQCFEIVSSERRGGALAKADVYIDILLGFDFYFLLRLTLLVFDCLDSLSAALQESHVRFHQLELLFASASESTNQLRNGFEELWSQTLVGAEDLDLESPAVPRGTRLPKCDPDQSPEDFYRKIFDAVVDNINSSLHHHFHSDVFQHMSRIEKFVLGEDDSTYLLNFYETDLDAARLRLHRDMFLDIARHRNVTLLGLSDAVDLFSGKQGTTLQNLLPELSKLLRIGLTIPFNSCTSERSLSCLDRIKTFLQLSTGQVSLHHVALLYGHQEIAEEINLDVIANEFIERTSDRRNTFSVI